MIFRISGGSLIDSPWAWCSACDTRRNLRPSCSWEAALLSHQHHFLGACLAGNGEFQLEVGTSNDR